MKQLITLVLSLMVSVAAQAKEATIQAKFRTFSVDGAIAEMYCASENGPQKVSAPARRRSEAVKYKGQKLLKFYRTAAEAELAETAPMAQVLLNPQYKNPLLVFLKRPGTKDQFVIKQIQDEPNGFSNGSMKFMNLCSHPIMMKVGQKGERMIRIKPFEVVKHTLPRDFKGNLPVVMAAKTKTGTQLLINTRVFPNKSVRDIYFISPRPNGGKRSKVKISTLRERGDVANMLLSTL